MQGYFINLGDRALVYPLIISTVVWIGSYIQYRKLVQQKKIDWLIQRILERAENSGNESEGDTEELSTMGDMGRLRLLEANDV
uniref:Protein Vpu n=1 Tax=Human immunodeficiency virus type 1 TaxID=11676 RepID=A0A0A1EA83_HV1|nr:vpu protein [Human immunodeficiency virus 1]